VCVEEGTATGEAGGNGMETRNALRKWSVCRTHGKYEAIDREGVASERALLVKNGVCVV